MKQNLFTISAIAAAVFASPSLAQTGGTADQSAAAQGSQTQGVRARQNPAAASPDTSYHSITNDVPSNSRNAGQTGAASTGVPSGPSSPALSGTQPAAVNGNAGETALPESMRIQRQTERTLPPPGDLIKKGGEPSTEAPGVVNTTVEQNRIDLAAPSRERLQIDDLSGRRAQEGPATSPPSAGLPARVTGSDGAGTGTSGSSVSGGGAIGSSTVGGSSPSSSASGAGSSTGSSSSGGGH